MTKNNLPYLNSERLNIIFDHVYEVVGIYNSKQKFYDNKLDDFLTMLQAMQLFNFFHRHDDTRGLFFLLNKTFNFERNSEGTTTWLALILAIQDLYRFSDEKLVAVLKQVSAIKYLGPVRGAGVVRTMASGLVERLNPI